MATTPRRGTNKPRYIERLNSNQKIEIQTKSDIIKAFREKPYVVRQPADCTAVNSTTLASPTGNKLFAPLEANRLYRVSIRANMTNSVATDGVKLGFNLSGTQTSAFLSGIGTVYDITNGGTTDNGVLTLSSGTWAGVGDSTTGSAVIIVEFHVIPQSDGVLTVYVAENNNAGAGGGVLKQNSLLLVEELEYNL